MSETFLALLESSLVGQWARETSWLFISAETLHFMGLSILLGALAVFDARIFGLVRQAPGDRLLGLIPLALFGFLINLVSGVVMFASDPFRYWSNPWFKWKLALIAFAGLNAVWFWFAEHEALKALPRVQAADVAAKVVAGASLLLWLAVLAVGRLLPYMETAI